MAKLVFGSVLRNDGSSVSSTDNDDSAVFGGLDVGFQESSRTFGESGELEDTRRSTSDE
jgi:hypothetical protein